MQRPIAACTIFLLFTAGAFSQVGGNAALTGSVVDPTGAAIANASVTTLQVGTDVKRSAATNNDGEFRLPSLPPATYRVTVEAPGFKTYVQEVTLLADQTGTLPVHLELGQAQETVTVEATATLVNTETPVVSQVIERSRVVELPLNGRNAADLTKLVAGAVDSNNAAGTTQGNTKQVPGTEAISVNGARPDQISYNLDGGTNEDLMSNTNNPFPFPDAVQEFSVQTNSFDTQYGTNAGAVVNVVSRSGTNTFHGDLFEFVRNREFNARNFFAAGVDPLKRNQFGGTIGGPIRKDKTFFFFGYQATRIRTQVNGNNTILPTAANLTGDFSNYLTANPSVNPQGKVIQINNPTTGLPFPNNQIPVSSVAVAMAKYLPISQAAPNGRIAFGYPSNQNLNEYIARVDQMLRGGQDKVFVRFYMDRFVLAPGFDGKNLLTDTTGSIVQPQNWAVGYTFVPNATIVNNFVATFVRNASDRGQGGNVPQFSDFGANVPQLPPSQGGIRAFGITGGYLTSPAAATTPGIGGFTDGRFVRNTYEIRDVATWTHGTQTFSFGGNYERDQSNIRNTDIENGNWQFSDVLTNLGLASFVMGHLHSYSQTSGDFSDSRQNVFGFFVEDRWKARPNLTLTMGLRYEPQWVMKEIYGRTEQFWPSMYAAGVRSQVLPTAPPGEAFIGDSFDGLRFPRSGEGPDLNNLAPRLGVAWDVAGNGKTVIRAGGGYFYSSRLPGLFLNDASISQPFSLRTDLTEPSSPNNLIPFNNPLQSNPSFAAQFPLRYTLYTLPVGGVPFTGLVTVYGLQPGKNWITPTTYDWNFTIERQVRPDTLVNISYVALKAIHLRQDADLNPRAPGVGTDASRPYKGYTDIIQNLNTGMSNYNALQVNLEKRPSGGHGMLSNITLLANYTFSKAMEIDLASNGGITDLGSSKGSGMSYYDPNQGHFETGPSPGMDRTHRIVASFVWDLPRLNGANPALRAILGGWQWTGIYTYLSGDAMTILAGTDRSETALGNDRADYVGPLSQYGQTATSASRGGCGKSACVSWLDTSYFALPPIGSYGNVGKGAFRGPGRTNVDTGILKNFYPLKSHEDIRFQLRGEFFNILNHAQFSDPDVTRNDANFGGIYGAADPRIIQ
ncbi:MAG: carboxypeptidase regulatory-like domain-containing protein, partial [Acidobacteriaceae bacterium]|nr:carboxypeptidase regulatory-like domain-containing protein [Acidobacteriaceae bacterium]